MASRRGPAPRSGFLLVTALAVAAAWLLCSGDSGTGAGTADGPVLADVLRIRSPNLTMAAIVVTTLGSTLVMSLLAVLAAGRLWFRHPPVHRVDAVYLVVATAGANVVFQTLKLIFGRVRPPVADQLVTETNQSLPSGHATVSLVVIGALVVLAWSNRSIAYRVAIVAAAAVWIVAVGASRVYLGVHWLTDVLAGWLVGATWLALCTTLRLAWARPVRRCTTTSNGRRRSRAPSRRRSAGRWPRRSGAR